MKHIEGAVLLLNALSDIGNRFICVSAWSCECDKIRLRFADCVFEVRKLLKDQRGIVLRLVARMIAVHAEASCLHDQLRDLCAFLAQMKQSSLFCFR